MDSKRRSRNASFPRTQRGSKANIVSQSDTSQASHHQRQSEINGSFLRTGAIRARGVHTALIGLHWISDIVTTIGQGQNSHNIQYVTISNNNRMTMR